MKTFSAPERRGERGQGIVIDFGLGLGLFIIMVLFIFSHFDQKLESGDKEAMFKTMEVKANYALDKLVKTKGIPENWRELPIEQVESIGLAVKDRELDVNKLTAFKTVSDSNYGDVVHLMGLEGFDFYFEFKGVDNIATSTSFSGNATEVVVQRIVLYKGETGIAKLKVYSIER